MVKLIIRLFLAIAILSGNLIVRTQALDENQTEIHYLAFASDYHNTEGSIENAMMGMPDTLEYVCLIGDMVGGRGKDAPPFASSQILSEVQTVLGSSFPSSNFAILWAAHDENVDDTESVVKCMGGYGSGVIYVGTNDDGSTAYYVYGIAHYEMANGSTLSQEAAQQFKDWVSGIDHTIPIIVLCHVPMIAKRADNRGAIYWNEALNYAATGVEGITSTDQTASVIRDVLFLSGHNHSIDPAEYYCPPGGTMNIQIDSTPASLLLQNSEPATEEEIPATAEAESEEEEEDDDPILTERPPRPRAEGVLSNIYYTSLTAGYLKTSGNASLVAIDGENIILTKYNGGENVILGIDPNTLAPAETEAVITRQQHIPSEIVIENETDPTCETDGHHDEAAYCTICGKELARSEVTDIAYGHDWGEWTITKEPTYAAEGEKVHVCGRDPSHRETEAIPALIPEPVVYTLAAGKDGSWTKGSGAAHVLKVQRSREDETSFDHFQSISVDGKVLASDCFTLNVSERTITLTGGFLQTLAAGTHDVEIRFDDGAVTTKLTVLDPAAAHAGALTRDENGWYLYTGEFGCSVLLFAAVLFCRLRYAEHN